MGTSPRSAQQDMHRQAESRVRGRVAMLKGMWPFFGTSILCHPPTQQRLHGLENRQFLFFEQVEGLRAFPGGASLNCQVVHTKFFP